MSKGLDDFYDLLSPIGLTKEGLNKYNNIEKELKTLEIIKEHILYCENIDCFVFVNVTKEVNELLKEALLCTK